MPLDNSRRYSTNGLTITRPRFPTPDLGVEGYPYMNLAEVCLRTVIIRLESNWL